MPKQSLEEKKPVIDDSIEKRNEGKTYATILKAVQEKNGEMTTPVINK